VSPRRNDPCPCDSGKKSKNCCGALEDRLFSSNEDLACVLVDQGNAKLAEDKFEEALSLYQQALSIHPEYARAHYNIGVAYQKSGRCRNAIASYQIALSIEPKDYDALYNLGIVSRDIGELGNAADTFRKAIDLNPESAETHYNLAITLRDMGETKDAAESFRVAVRLKPDYLSASISLALIAWLHKNWDACQKHLHLASKNMGNLSGRDKKSIIAYHKFLMSLLKYKDGHPDYYLDKTSPRKIYAIGDSHCLSICHTTVGFNGLDYSVEPRLVLGCKAWHIANNQNSSYSCSFKEIVRSIPTGSIVITMFGEIDCRLDEGVIKHHKKTNNNLSKSIIELVENYVNNQSTILKSKNLNQIICNIPAPLFNEDNISSENKKLRVTVVKEFNHALAINAEKKQIPILDAYGLSKTIEGTSNSKWNLDKVHLKPTAFIHMFKNL
jgi:Flp pilus assembly protein TadD